MPNVGQQRADVGRPVIALNPMLTLPWPCLTWPVTLAMARAGDRPDGGARLSAADREQRDERLAHLVDRYRDGDTGSFEEIVLLIREQIYAVAWRHCQHEDDALDIVQNVLVRVFRALPMWKGKSRFTTWVHRITLNATVDWFRRHGKHQAKRIDAPGWFHPEEEEALHTPPDPALGVQSETPRHAAQRSEVIERVREALPKLTEMQRNCFLLRHWHGQSIEEIAETVGCGQGSVKQHLHRAAKRLRDLLKDLEATLEPGAMSAGRKFRGLPAADEGNE